MTDTLVATPDPEPQQPFWVIYGGVRYAEGKTNGTSANQSLFVLTWANTPSNKI